MSTDIILNGAGYMVQPGTAQNPGYKRLQDGFPEGSTQRTSITDFFGGQGRSLQLERDRFGDSLAIGPALNGQGVTPWPHIETVSTGIINTFPNKNARVPHTLVRDHMYFTVGRRLYRTPAIRTGSGDYGILVHTFDSWITDITSYGSKFLLIAFGSEKEIQFYNPATDASTTLFAGDYAHHIGAYSGYAIWSDARTAADNPGIIRMVKGTGIDTRLISYDVIGITTVGAELMLVTRSALFSFTGRVVPVMVPNPGYTIGGTAPAQMPGFEWTGDFKPFFQQGVMADADDFRFISGYGGRTIAWIANGIHELIPSGERAGWRSTGLTGRRCFGGTVAAGYVVVCIESHDGNNEIWAYDGNGWWRVASQPMPGATGTWCNPIPVGEAGASTNNVKVFIEGSAQCLVLRLNENIHPVTGAYQTNYPGTTAQFVTPLIDASDRDKFKTWRKIGAVFAAPTLRGNTASTDQIHIGLDYSTDNGQTWVNGDNALGTAQSLTGNTLANMNIDLEGVLAGVTSRFIMLRVRWVSPLDWAPILTGIWVEHETLNNPARRRKWQLRIHARDQEVDRNGVVLTRTGRQLIADLWQAWENDVPLTFRDIDYADAPVQRTVRIVGITEHVAQPADSQQWGDSLITLNLVEV